MSTQPPIPSDRSARDWPEGRDYTGTCHTCGHSFVGPKWRIQGKTCRVCVEAQPIAPPVPDAADPVVHHIAINICQPCLDGEGKQCRTPGCALFLHNVDMPITRELYEILPDSTASYADLKALRDLLQLLLSTMPKDWFIEPGRRASHAISGVLDASLTPIPAEGAPTIPHAASEAAKQAAIVVNEYLSPWSRTVEFGREMHEAKMADIIQRAIDSSTADLKARLETAEKERDAALARLDTFKAALDFCFIERDAARAERDAVPSEGAPSAIDEERGFSEWSREEMEVELRAAYKTLDANWVTHQRIVKAEADRTRLTADCVALRGVIMQARKWSDSDLSHKEGPTVHYELRRRYDVLTDALAAESPGAPLLAVLEKAYAALSMDSSTREYIPAKQEALAELQKLGVGA